MAKVKDMQVRTHLEADRILKDFEEVNYFFFSFKKKIYSNYWNSLRQYDYFY